MAGNDSIRKNIQSGDDAVECGTNTASQISSDVKNGLDRENVNARLRHSVENRQPVLIDVSVEFYEFALRWKTTPAAIITDYVQRIINADKLTVKQSPKIYQ